MSKLSVSTEIPSKRKYLFAALFFIVGVLQFILIFKQPYRLDDLSWGGAIGVQRLNNLFCDYNGRYIGNFAVLFLTRIPVILRALYQELFVVILLVESYVILKKDEITSSLFFILYFTMPLPVLTQSVLWISGFSNYYISAALVLLVLLIDFRCIEKEEGNKKDSVIGIILFGLCVIAGQLIIETATIYIVVLSVVVLALYIKRYKKLSAVLVTQLLCSIAGFVIMFTNASYMSAYVHDGTNHKAITIADYGMDAFFYNLYDVYQGTIARMWFGNNLLLNIVLTVIVIAICYRLRNTIGYILGSVGVVFLACFIYDVVDGDRAVLNSNIWLTTISIAYTIFIFLVVLLVIDQTNIKTRIMILIGSTVMLMLPTLVATPIHDRCFFNTFLIWAFIVSEFFRFLMKDININSKICDNAAAMTWLMIIVISIATIVGQMLSWKIETIRMSEIEKCKEENSPFLIIPRVPNAGVYCFGANLEDEYWWGIFKDYYDIDSSVSLIFIDYEDYLAWVRAIEYNEGNIPVGWQLFNDHWYYINSEGGFYSGFTKLSGTWYYFQPDGSAFTGLLEAEGEFFFFENDGTMHKGWEKSAGNWYYFNNSGVMVRDSEMEIGSSVYYFDVNGVCLNP